MAAEPLEQITLELDDQPERYVREHLAHSKLRAGNIIGIVLVGGAVLALILYTLTVWIAPDEAPRLDGLYDKWFSLVGPLIGATVGFYFGTSKRE
ncbi:MAG: hypothetical protein A49_22360 [Methyloceanibacter sp.]|nr:MAG: hypothetical protein A49_22360 [Methyloceanibacter sp.]